MIIIPTILEKDPNLAQERWETIKELTRWVSVDVVDGIFTYGKTFDLEQIVKIIPEQDRLIDIHLMVKEPEGWINKVIEAGASRVVGQVEMMTDWVRFISKAKEEGLEAGLGWDIDTEFEAKRVPGETDLVLFLARKAGFKKVEFEVKVLDKVRAAKRAGFRVAVDGGIGKAALKQLEEAGVDIAYVGHNYLELANE